MTVRYIENHVLWYGYNPLNDELDTLKPITRYPFIMYPNGIPCYEANLYIRKLVEEGVSTFGKKGGTLHAYASQISLLVDFTYNNNISLSQLTDSFFTIFINSLSAERRADKVTAKRKYNTVISIGKRCLDFLKLVEETNHLKFFIGTTSGHAITISVEKRSRKIEGYSGTHDTFSYKHISFPDPNATNKKTPISIDVHDKLFNYLRSNNNIQVRERDLALFHALDQLGARRAEIINIRVSDIKDALRSNDKFPRLRLINLKQKDAERKERYVPVSRVFLSEISNYIRRYRRVLIKNKLGKAKANDHGYLFVSTTTGKPLSEDTLTTYFTNWRNALGIEEELHAHLFRHTYVTNKLIEIIESRGDVKNPDDFQRLIVNTEWFKRQLQEWTGHKYLSSMEDYINLAFARRFKFDAQYKTLQIRSAIESTKKAIGRIKSNLESGAVTNHQATEEIQTILKSLELDIA
ncbi:site-specific integrase [Vibrio sp. Makdt]|uniref:tyrosine-type recombinase/integrase n=1 Tax=Vibrio sp. Makdt TaxID=2998828 RepID=UPI0022CD9346|nr:site-specific integrase [Vibrio sp. Makdt]MDA0155134.1 site-specific integrase [Vibrio sp. Makdt]